MKTILSILSAVLQFILQGYIALAVRQCDAVYKKTGATDEALAGLSGVMDRLVAGMDTVMNARMALRNRQEALDKRAETLGI